MHLEKKNTPEGQGEIFIDNWNTKLEVDEAKLYYFTTVQLQ